MPFSPAGPAALLPPCIAAGPVRYICVSPGTRLADGTFRAKLTAGSVIMKGGYDMKWTDVLIRMGLAIRKGSNCGKKYTRIMVPSFLFILFADIFFVIASLFQGGLFRGWLARKK